MFQTIQFYVSNAHNFNYMALALYRNTLERIIRTYITSNFEYVFGDDINNLIYSESNLIIMHMNCLSNIENMYPDHKINLLNHSNINKHLILIEAEHYSFFDNLLCDLNNASTHIHIFEYNSLNYNHIKQNYPNINIQFMPLVYDPYLETYYETNIDPNITNTTKDIDILFYGGLNDRRLNILNKLKESYNVVYVVDLSGPEICRLIQHSKIVLNILYYDFNSIFDYYRNSLLLSNHALLVCEKPKHLFDNTYDDISDILMYDYDNIIDTVHKLMAKSDEELNHIIDTQYKCFTKTKNKLYVQIINFFTNYFNFDIKNNFICRPLQSDDYLNNYMDLMYEFTNYEYQITHNDFTNYITTNNITYNIILVIESKLNNQIIGSGSIFKLSKIHNNPIAQIEDVIISQNYRNIGLGRLLIDNLINMANNIFKPYKIILNAHESNIKFYESCGFIKSGVEMKFVN